MKGTMSPREALQKSYTLLSPHSDPQKWEFSSNLFHLTTILEYSSKNDSIVDVGCGIGILALALKLLGYDVTGVDKFVFESGKVLHNAYRIHDIDTLKKVWKEQGLRIDSGDLFEIEGGTQFDTVVSVAVIEHQKNLKGFIESTLNYAKKGGKIYIATPNVSNALNRFRMFFGKAPMANIESFYKGGDDFNGHWREYTVSELKSITRLSGQGLIKAGNAQTTPFQFTKNYKKWHVNIGRIFGYIIPHSGDTNYVWIKKQ